MSLKRKLLHSVHIANSRIGGAKSTKMARLRHNEEFIDFCLENKLGLNDLRFVTKEMFNDYAKFLSDPECIHSNSIATIHNKLASVRAVLKACGVNLQTLKIASNADLEMDSRSRQGTKLPVTDEIFEEAITKAMSLGELGFVHCIQLERYLGLRGLEAVMSTSALSTYAQEAIQMNGRSLSEMKIFDGTKGGRPRETAVIVKFAQETLTAIKDALEYAAKNGGYLIIGKTSGLKSARSKYHRIARVVGLVGEYAPHSLRYRYACDKLMELRALGVPRQEALALASKWLGHGKGRGRWVSMVYGRTVMSTYKKSSRRSSQRDALRQIEDMLNSQVE